LNFAPVGTIGDSTPVYVEIPADLRKDTFGEPFLSNSFQTIVLCDCCDESSLGDGSTTLEDGSPLPDSIDYYLGTGIKTIKLRATASCDGFISGELSLLGVDASLTATDAT
jgi:hypothetical protein